MSNSVSITRFDIHADKDELNFPPSSEVAAVLSSVDWKAVNRYSKEPELLHVLAQKHGVPLGTVFLEQGTIGVIHRVFDGRVRDGTSILLPELGFPYYHKLADSYGIDKMTFRCIKKQDCFGYDLEDILDKLKQKPALLVLIDPESPLGFSLPEDDLVRILTAAHPETLVMLDQAHEGFREDHVKDIGKLVSAFPHLLVARSFSKYYGLAGMRIAYAVCGSAVKNRIHYHEKYLGFDNVAQKLALAALASEDHYRENARQIRGQKLRFNQALRKLAGYEVFETDHASGIVKVPDAQFDLVSYYAQQLGINMRDLGTYHRALEHHYRITMCPAEQMDHVIDIFESVAWLYDLDVNNSDAVSHIHTRKSGYTVHRKELPCSASDVLMGLHKVIVPPGTSVPRHSHAEQDELFVFFSPVYFTLNDSRFSVQSGDWIQLKPGDVHGIESLLDQFARFTCLRFPYTTERKQGTYDPRE